MSIVDALIEFAYWLLLVDSADKRDEMPKGYRRRYALVLYRLVVVGLLVYFVVWIFGWGS